MSGRFRRVFFDVTGTLLRVRGSVGAVYAPIAACHGLVVSVERIDAAFRHAIGSAPPPIFPEATPETLAALERGWWRDIVLNTFAAFGAFPRFEAFFDEVFEA